MPVWQVIYDELKAEDGNFEIISIAQDTGGEDAAGPIFDAADVTYTSLIDVNHLISSLYNLVNVPSGVWIDEEGRIARINEGTYAQEHFNGAFGTNEYVPIVRTGSRTEQRANTSGIHRRCEKALSIAPLRRRKHSPLSCLGLSTFN